MKKIIRVLVVEDSPAMSKVITDILNSDKEIIVIGVAGNGKEAIEFASRLKPDIITMDIHMPIMDGLEATKQIMAYNPTPILILSASVFQAEMNKAFRAISYGALDVVDKSRAGDLAEKVKFLSAIKVIKHPLGKLEKEARRVMAIKTKERIKKDISRENIVAVVTSTGGPQALLQILRRLPRAFPCGILIVQHITRGFIQGLADWLNSQCAIDVKVAGDKEIINRGTAYLAPSDLQMRVARGGRISLCDEPPYDGYRPSGNVLLFSVSDTYKQGTIGVILTGMGKDGTLGIKAVKEKQGRTIAQDEQTSVIFGMPKVAIDMGVVDIVSPLDKIAQEIVELLEDANQ